MAELKVDTEKVSRQANQMDQLEQDLAREIQTLHNIMTLTKRYWEGPAAQIYMNKLENLCSNINRTKIKMGDVTQDIRTVLSRILWQEEEHTRNAMSLGGGAGGGAMGGR